MKINIKTQLKLNEIRYGFRSREYKLNLYPANEYLLGMISRAERTTQAKVNVSLPFSQRLCALCRSVQIANNKIAHKICVQCEQMQAFFANVLELCRLCALLVARCSCLQQNAHS